ncbi:MAG: hypothetical protein HY812_06910 [Planctomycetes bacterium]|nr:hypothetical protein [Planctomycetota bacterium]
MRYRGRRGPGRAARRAACRHRHSGGGPGRRAAAGGLIPAEAFLGLDLADPPRILLKTSTHPDGRRQPEAFAALSPDAALALAQGGALLVGIDTPGVDPAGARELAAHLILASAGVRWLENLDLSRVEPGIYELIALPLRIPGADASPVRAVLVEHPLPARKPHA